MACTHGSIVIPRAGRRRADNIQTREITKSRQQGLASYNGGLRMEKYKLALAGALLMAPISALAQQAEPENTEKPLPAVTVVTDPSTNTTKPKDSKSRVAKKKAGSKTAKPADQPAAGAEGESALQDGATDTNGIAPPSVTSIQRVGKTRVLPNSKRQGCARSCYRSCA